MSPSVSDSGRGSLCLGKNALPFQNVILSVLAGLGIEILTEQEGFNGRRELSQNKMGTARMFPLILSMAVPAMFSMLVQALY